MKKNKLIIISGPSGVGKSIILKKILKKIPSLDKIVTCTTRKKRPGEKEGWDHYFISEKKFKQMKKNNKFLEWALVHGKYYGTPKDEIKKKLSKKNCISEIDIQGAKQIEKKMPEVISIFIKPKNIKELALRIKARGKMSRREFQLRLKNAKKEMAQSKKYDYQVTNQQNKLEKAVKKTLLIIQKELKIN